MFDLHQDTSFWVMLSTVLCIGFIAWKAYRPVLQSLDARADTIRVRLQEAADLHAEAEKILVEYKAKSVTALAEAEQILRNAEQRAEKMRIEMESELNQTLARQEAGVKLRLARLEQEAIEAVKMAVIDAALTQAKEGLAKKTVDADALQLSLERIVKTLH